MKLFAGFFLCNLNKNFLKMDLECLIKIELDNLINQAIRLILKNCNYFLFGVFFFSFSSFSEMLFDNDSFKF